MSKIGKFLKNNGPFWRDLLLKKYPIGSEHHLTYPSLKTRNNGVSIVGDLLSGLDPYQVRFPIDIVYTWVDGSDSGWNKNRLKYLNNTTEFVSKATDSARFSCHEELRYSLRSISAYAPWVNKIYIVTDNQRPSWLNIDSDKIVIVDHREIIPEQYLPTFNSHVIEANIHKIKGLSEQYIYFNDDVMLTRPVEPEYFFGSNGKAHVFATRCKVPKEKLSPCDTPPLMAVKNVRDLIQDEFERQLTFSFEHTYHAQLRSVNEEIIRKWKKRFDNFFPNKFRGENDLALPSCFFPNYAYLKGQADIRQTTCLLFNIRDVVARKNYQAALSTKDTQEAPFSMCLNDVHTRGETDKVREQEETKFLQEYFPLSCEFEK